MKEKTENQTFYIYAKIWCPRRSLDASRLYDYFVKNGLHHVNDPEKADFIVIYSCGGFSKDEEYSILTIKHSLKNQSAKVIITGCLPKIDPEKLEGFNALVIPPEDLGKLDSLIQAKMSYSDCPTKSIVVGVHDLYHGSLLHNFSNRFEFSLEFLKICAKYIRENLLHKSNDPVFSQNVYKLEIAKGCVGNCTYCAIKLAMEKFHSYPEEQIIENFRNGLKHNYKRYSLVAGDIGCYGIDIHSNLPSLLKKIFEVNGDYKISLVDLNAKWFVKYYPELLSILKKNFRKVSEIIIPIQSGSDRILKSMNRQYKIDDVIRCFLDLQKNIPEIKLITHIMVGFPGETEIDFQKSLELVRLIRFSKVMVYRYEDRPNTKAFDMPNKVKIEAIDERLRMLAKEDNVTIVH